MDTGLIKRTIDGDEYEFEQFGAKQGLKVLIRLSKIVGKPLALAAGVSKKGADGETTFSAETLATAVEALTDRMDQDDVIELLTLLCSEKALCNGAKINFDSHYSRKFDRLFKVTEAALEVQFGNFFDALQALLPQSKATKSAESSPKT